MQFWIGVDLFFFFLNINWSSLQNLEVFLDLLLFRKLVVVSQALCLSCNLMCTRNQVLKIFVFPEQTYLTFSLSSSITLSIQMYGFTQNMQKAWGWKKVYLNNFFRIILEANWFQLLPDLLPERNLVGFTQEVWKAQSEHVFVMFLS